MRILLALTLLGIALAGAAAPTAAADTIEAPSCTVGWTYYDSPTQTGSRYDDLNVRAVAVDCDN